MKLKTFEAYASCGHFAPNYIEIGSVVKKLSPKNLGVSNEVRDTVYNSTYLSSTVTREKSSCDFF